MHLHGFIFSPPYQPNSALKFKNFVDLGHQKQNTCSKVSIIWPRFFIFIKQKESDKELF